MHRLLDWPTNVGIRSQSPLSGPRAVGAGSTEGMSGWVQTVGGPYGLWRWQFGIPPMTGENFRRYRGMITALHGGANAARITFFDPDGPYIQSYKPWTIEHLYHKLCVPFDGSDAAVAATDESISHHTLSFLGTSQLDTANKKFGTASLLTDGTNGVSVADSSDFHLGTEDFTIHGWIDPASITGFPIIIQQTDFASDRAFFLSLGNDGGANINNVLFFASIDGSTDAIFLTSANGTITLGGFIHYAVTRKGSTFRLFIDGVLVATATNSGSIFNSSQSLLISSSLVGHHDQVEILKGICLWEANFTPPASADHDTAASVAWSNDKFWAGLAEWVSPAAPAAKEDTEITLENTAWGHALGVGDWLGFTPWHFGLYIITEVIAEGEYRIWPPLRKAVTVDDYATLLPVMAMRLESESAASANRGLENAESPTMTMVEVPHDDIVEFYS